MIAQSTEVRVIAHFFTSGLHTFQFRLHILVGLHAQIILCSPPLPAICTEFLKSSVSTIEINVSSVVDQQNEIKINN